jgi:hypothetical protein
MQTIAGDREHRGSSIEPPASLFFGHWLEYNEPAARDAKQKPGASTSQNWPPPALGARPAIAAQGGMR